MSKKVELRFGSTIVGELREINLDQPSYFADYQLSDGLASSSRVTEYYDACIAHCRDPELDDFSSFEDLFDGWTIVAPAGHSYKIDSAPLFDSHGQLTFGLDGAPVFQVGDIVEGVAKLHRPFGVFVEIDPITTGLLKIVDITDDARQLSEAGFPHVGESVRAAVVGCVFSDFSFHVALSTKRSAMGRNH